MRPLVVLDVVGLTPATLAHMPNLRALAAGGWQAHLGTVLPAVTCSVQSTLLTGLPPARHGIVGNGWYLRELGEILLWRQHNRLVAGEKLWETARRAQPGYRAANVCWWYAMGASTDVTVTPRPVYHADGRKSPDCYVRPPALHDRLTAALGAFPLFSYWGPTASLRSTEWIVEAARLVLAESRPHLLLVYLPHLDYDLQRYGPDSAQAVAAATAADAALAPLLADAEAAGAVTVALSEYGITSVRRCVHINRRLRAEGLLQVYRQANGEHLDPWTSRAFAVADHQIAHVYIADPADVRYVRGLLAALPGVDLVLDRAGQAAFGLDHPRAGELVAIAEPDAWFSYYHWLSDQHAPDYARGVDIHRKPGYDPAELFVDPKIAAPKVKIAGKLLKKKLGFRYLMDVIPTDASLVRGSHGVKPASPDEQPLLISRHAADLPPEIEPTAVFDIVLAHLQRK